MSQCVAVYPLLDHDCVAADQETPVFENDFPVRARNASVLVDVCPYMSIIGYIYIYIYVYIYIYAFNTIELDRSARIMFNTVHTAANNEEFIVGAFIRDESKNVQHDI